MKKLGEKIRRAREAKGISQEGLAERLGIHVNTLCRYEKGKAEVKQRTVEQIAEILGTSEAELRFNGYQLSPPLPLPVRLIVDALSGLSESEQFEVLVQVSRMKEVKGQF